MPTPHAGAQALQAADQQCLGCHGMQGLEKKLSNAETLSLHVPAEGFAKSVHGMLGCAGCHADVQAGSHPPSNKDVKSLRDYAIAAAQACRGCHGDKFEQWDKSIHASLVRDGNAAAPICSDCHRPHEVTKAVAGAVQATPCQACHADIHKAYAGSMHAQALGKSTASGAPLCSGCHSAHDVKPVAVGEGPKAACIGCHAGALEAHQIWLPNAAQHFESVSCPACHAPTARRKVDLMLIDSQSKARVTEQRGVPLFSASSASDGTGLDAMALWNVLQTLNREGAGGKTVLRGRLEAASGPEAHQLADKSKAISDCKTCHREGSRSIPERDHLGRRTGRQARPGRREPRRPELGHLDRCGERLLCDRRHPHHVAGHPADPRIPRRPRGADRPPDHALVVQALLLANPQAAVAGGPPSGGDARTPA